MLCSRLLNSAVEDGALHEICGALKAARENGKCDAFGTPHARPAERPSAEALSALPEAPTDERSAEVAGQLSQTRTLTSTEALFR